MWLNNKQKNAFLKYFIFLFTHLLQVESNEDKEKDPSTSGAGMMMQLRRAANHPLLLRRFYDDDKLLSMSKLMLKVYIISPMKKISLH